MTRNELIWRNFWLALRRAPRDKRALYAILWLLWVIGYFTHLVRTFSYLGIWGSLCWATILGLAVGLTLLIRRNNARSEQSLLSLSNHTSSDFQELAEHRRRLVALLLKTAVLVDRAGCELSHNSGKVSEEHRGLCRRRTLDIAQRPELWNQFTEEDRGLLLATEGSWAWDMVWPRLLLSEDVRVLRWVIQLDSILVPFEFLQFELTSAVAITVRPSIVEGEGCMPPWDLRPARDMADRMLNRCVAEGLARGFLAAEENADTKAAYVDLAERMGSDRSQDLILGMQTVADTPEDRIRWIAQLALRRVRTLDRIIGYLGGTSEVFLELEPTFAPDAV